jgi:hypothetical protein
MPKNQKTEQQSKQQPYKVISMRRGVAALLALALIAATALATVTVTRLASRDAAMNQPTVPAQMVEQTRMRSAVAAPASRAAAQQQRPGRDELRIELSNNGFAPAEVTHAAGVFAIAVENLDIAGEYVLRLKDAGGTLVKEVSVQKGSASWTADLTAGSYTLSEASHPDWVCRIDVQ